MYKKYYDILGLPTNANENEIKKAYKKLALKYHPDKNKDKDAGDHFKNISEAYQILTNKDKYSEQNNFQQGSFVNPDELFKTFFSKSSFFSTAFEDDFFKDVFDNMNIHVNNQQTNHFRNVQSFSSSFTNVNSNNSNMFCYSKQVNTQFHDGKKVETITEMNNGVKKVTKIITDANGNRTITNENKLDLMN